jgi:hypothetical protein
MQSGNEIEDALGGARIEIAGRLVSQQQLWAGDQSAS